MHRIITRRSKKATTLVELVVAMAIMAIFAVACASLIYPISKIYTHMNNLSRSQILADTVVESLRAECARTYITSANDVWISAGSGDRLFAEVPASTSGPGTVLVIRKNAEYCETLAADYPITGDLCYAVYCLEKAGDTAPLTGDTTSRAIYRLFVPVPVTTAQAENIDYEYPAGYLHYGYFKSGADLTNGPFPAEYYDFTDPFLAPTYNGFTIKLNYHDIKYSSDGNVPVYVLVDVNVYDGTENVYTRSDVVLSFASQVIG